VDCTNTLTAWTVMWCGSLQSLDWTSGLDWWTGLVDWTSGLTFYVLKITIVISSET